MNAADERRRAGPKRPFRAVERDLKDAVKGAAAKPARDAGLRIAEKEWVVSPVEWPRVGAVDLVVTRGGPSDAMDDARR